MIDIELSANKYVGLDFTEQNTEGTYSISGLNNIFTAHPDLSTPLEVFKKYPNGHPVRNYRKILERPQPQEN